MIEQSGSSSGTFRIRATGYRRRLIGSLVATFKRASFLDFLYFTQLETSDPVTYNNQATINGAYEQCTKTIQQGRYNQEHPRLEPRAELRLGSTSSAASKSRARCTRTTRSRSATASRSSAAPPTDTISVSAPPPGWYRLQRQFARLRRHLRDERAGAHPAGRRTAALRTIADPSYRFTGQTKIVLNGTRRSPVNGGASQTDPRQRRHLRLERRLLVGLQPLYGRLSRNVHVRQRLRARELLRPADHRRRERHHHRREPRPQRQRHARSDRQQLRPRLPPLLKPGSATQTSRLRRAAATDPTAPAPSTNLRIDAAILAIQHSFIVDHYSCGDPLGTLTVNGAIAQRFRGAVGTFSQQSGQAVSGYSKRYTYDDRLRYISPPHFLDPVESAWHVQRETVD